MSPKLQDLEACGTSVLLLLKLHSPCTFLELGRGGTPPQNWTRVFFSQLVGKKKLMEFQFFHSEIFLKFQERANIKFKSRWAGNTYEEGTKGYQRNNLPTENHIYFCNFYSLNICSHSHGLIFYFIASNKLNLVCVLSRFSHVQLCVTLWTVALQAALSMEFSRQEYWSGLPCRPPGDLSDPGIGPVSLVSPALAGGDFTTGVT